MLEEDDVDGVEEAWGYCLVGLFAGRFPGLAAVNNLKEGWKVKCTHWRHRSGWLVFKFQSDEDRLQVLNGGPYFAYGSNLMLKILPSCFRFEGEDVTSVPIWIQLPDLPLDCWNARALSKIVSRVGKPITTDKMTLTKERLSFARVLVEVDVSAEIVSDVEIRLPTGVVYNQLVIHEFTPKFCKRCKTFGHVEGTCGKGSEGSRLPYVAKKKRPSVGVGPSAPVAPDPVMGARVDSGAVQAGPRVKPTGNVVGSSAPPVVEGLVVSGAGHTGADCVPAAGVDRGLVADDEGCSGHGLTGDGLRVAGEVDAPKCPGEDLDPGDVGWCTVGKKGKKKKQAAHPGAVQQQPEGVGLQGGDPGPARPVDVAPTPGRAEEPALAVGKVSNSGNRVEERKPHPKPYIPQWKKGRNRQSYLYFQ